MTRNSIFSVGIILLSFLFSNSGATEYLDAVRDLKLGNAEGDTARLQKALDAGKRSIYFPKGNYRLGTLELPGNTRLLFSAEADIKADSTMLRPVESWRKKQVTALFLLKGDNIAIDGLHAVSLFRDTESNGNLLVPYLAFGKNCRNVTFRRINIDFPPLSDKTPVWEVPEKVPNGIFLENCSDILFADSRIRGINHGLQTFFCTNVTVKDNVAFNSSTLVDFDYGSRGLNYTGNWSRKLRYPCIFRGGTPDPSRVPPVPQGSSATVLRNLSYEERDPAGVRKELKAAGADRIITDENSELHHLFGVYDIRITNNYAEYGRTLTWGNRARQVVIANNISRFMNDYSYGVEGCENVLFANNISINARSCSIMSMYWGNKITVTGNQCIVRDEPFRPEFSDFPEQSAYWGGLLRFHHGPESKNDREAGSRYGAGEVLISGNLFINELGDRVRGVILDENQRDFTISANKFVNSNIYKKKGSGSLKILGNDFTSTLTLPHPVILFRGNGELIARDNVMRYLGGSSRLEPDRNIYHTQDEAQTPNPEERLQQPWAAVIAGNRWSNPALAILENNLIEGWNQEVVSIGSGSRPVPCRLLIRNNTLEGTIRLTGTEQDFRCHITGNLAPDTLQETRLERIGHAAETIK